MSADELKNKVCLVTGASSGIGREAALQLAQAGARVVMLCRSAERGEAARQYVAAGGGSIPPDLVLADLSSQCSIRAAVEQIKSCCAQVHVLINNAANFEPLKQVTLSEEGYEVIFATNHLGPFLLTNLLLGHLQAGAPAAVLNVSSKGLVVMPGLRIEFDDLQQKRRARFSSTHAYYHSKLAQVMFTYELARRLQGSGVSANCVRVPAVRLDESRLAAYAPVLRALYRLKAGRSITAQHMAAVYVRLVSEPNLARASGQYYDEHCQPVRSSPASYDQAAWLRLWQVSAGLCGLGE